MKIKHLYTVLTLAIIANSSFTQEIPRLIYYQGNLASSSGAPIDGAQTMRFSIWSSNVGGNRIWGPESHSVPVNEGLFSVMLGSQNPIPLEVFSSRTRYLEIVIGNETLSPRQQIVSVPYTYTATSVSGASNVFPSNGNVGIGVNNPSDKLQVNGMIRSTTGGFKFPDNSIQIKAATDGGGENLAQTLSIGNSAGGNDLNDVGNIRIGGDSDIILSHKNAAVQLRQTAHLLFTDQNDETRMTIEASNKFLNWSVIGLSGFLSISNFTETQDYFTFDTAGRFFAAGDIVANGTKNFVEVHPYDHSKEIVYTSLEGGEAGTYSRGTARLSNGEAIVRLPDHFEFVTSSVGLTAQVTPRGNCNGIYVLSVSPTELMVKELQNGISNAEFAYLVQGVRKGYEDRKVIRDKKTRKLVE